MIDILNQSPFTSAFDPLLWMTIGLFFLTISLWRNSIPQHAFGLGAIFVCACTAVIPNWMHDHTQKETLFLMGIWIAISFFFLWAMTLIAYLVLKFSPCSEPE